jgi:hypothetical protein
LQVGWIFRIRTPIIWTSAGHAITPVGGEQVPGSWLLDHLSGRPRRPGIHRGEFKTSVSGPRSGERVGLACGAAGGTERPCSSARCRRNPTRTFLPRTGNRGRLAWGAGGGNERPCSPARSWRNPTGTFPPPADPQRVVLSPLISPPGLRQSLKSDSGWRLHGESELRAGTTFYPCRPYLNDQAPYTVFVNRRLEARAGEASPSNLRRPGRTPGLVSVAPSSPVCP